MVSLKVLTKIALFGGIITVGTGAAVMERIQYRLRHEDHYKKSVTLLQNYQPATNYLGGPVGCGRLDLRTKGLNQISTCEAKLTIPVKGQKDNGTLYSKCSRNSIEENWEVDELVIEIDGIKRSWKFYDRSRLTSNNNTDDSLNDSTNNETKNDEQLLYIQG
ncbi:cytochrome c oxidase assembly factor 1 homolog [Tubulanus polymorphus]|uniref:cytochrome c oxidase assembly factor 1 homolog n=1 Tax=Tubulanus polymorphus TaxID=672921 RepID=UPI003DA3629B